MKSSVFLSILCSYVSVSALSVRKHESTLPLSDNHYDRLEPVTVPLTPAVSPNRDSYSEAAKSRRMKAIDNMYAFEGFVYDLEACHTSSKMLADFRSMKAMGARTVLSILYCRGNDGESYYSELISAAQQAGLWIIPGIWTLPLEDDESFHETIMPRIKAVTQAVINSPDSVLAVALGDEPLYDRDFGTPQALASNITDMKATFSNAGLSIPVSISELAYGWKHAGDISSVQHAVDFFMINNFPYFARDATKGGSSTSWKDFLKDMDYYNSIRDGKKLMVAQTGWPSNKKLYSPNSRKVVASVWSEEEYWNLLNSHCNNYFKANGIAWMWRSYDDTMKGWGVKTKGEEEKWKVKVESTC